MKQEMKDDLVLLSNIEGCSLDGKPAKVCGRLNRFATVAQIDGPLALEWAWETVKRIMDTHRRFKS